MPDWSYRTLFRPALFALPARLARDVALTTIGTLARSPLGGRIIDLLGHMRPARELRREVFGHTFAAPVGFAAELDPSGYALPGLARFGVGFAVVGPATNGSLVSTSVARDRSRQAIVIKERYTDVLFGKAFLRIADLPKGFPVIARVRGDAAGAIIAAELAELPSVVALAMEDVDDPSKLPSACPVLLVLLADTSQTAALHAVESAQRHWPRMDGVLIVGALREAQSLIIGAPVRDLALQLVRCLRDQFRDNFALIAGGGIHEPLHALQLFQAGADLVQVDSGLVFSGPGLVKRINEALLAEHAVANPLHEDDTPAPRYAWFWLWLMGLAMFCGGTLALVIAGTLVVLPYDEQFVGMSREELALINPRLLPFMSHDRVTLAGTMLALGILYSGLGWHAVRRGYHWAWVATITSALIGFLSFFLFLGFGYFEPFHAFVSTALLQLLVLGWHAPLGPRRDAMAVPLTEDWRWRLAQWGQLLLVIECIAVLVGGLVISVVGSTYVFVAEDLEYMQTCTAEIAAANPRLLALVAHDRATFGGMLISCGLVTLFAALWGFAAGRSWLWKTLFYSGVVGYVCTIIVHFLVGYVDIIHLLPAYVGLALHVVALGLAGPYLWWAKYRVPLEPLESGHCPTSASADAVS